MEDNNKNYIIDTKKSINRKIYDEILLKLDRIESKISRINRDIINVKKKVDKIYDLKNTKYRW